MSVGAVLIGAFAVWWIAWAVHYAVGRARSTDRDRVGLLAYEAYLALPIILTGIVLRRYDGAAGPVLGSVSWYLSVPAGGVIGLAFWVGCVARADIWRLRGLRLRNRLWLSCVIDAWNATGEEVAFRFLLLAGLSAVTGNIPVSVLITALAFGGHHYAVGGLRVAALHTVTGLLLSAVAVSALGWMGALGAHLAYNIAAACMKEVEMSRGHRTVWQAGRR